MLYYSKNYRKFIAELRKIDFVKNLKDTKRIEWKAKFNREIIEKGKGYDSAKYALPALRSRLQLLTYIKHKKLIWDLKKTIKMNKEFLTLEEQKFLVELDYSVKKRQEISINKSLALTLSDKINNKILELLKVRLTLSS